MWESGQKIDFLLIFTFFDIISDTNKLIYLLN